MKITGSVQALTQAPEKTKPGWVSLAVLSVCLEVAGLVAQTGNNEVLYRFHIRDDIVLL